MKQLLEEICKMRKGHWGLVEPKYRPSMQPDFYESLKKTFRGHFSEVDCIDLPRVPSETSEAVLTKLQEAVAIVRDLSMNAVCFGLRNFHELESEAQIEALIATRSVRESTSDVAVIVFISGSWNRYRLAEVWKIKYSATSPCPDQKCIRAIGSCGLTDFQERLLSDGWMSNQPTELDKIASEALLEFTGGDEDLISEILETLQMSGRPIQSYQDIVSDVVCSDAVLAAIESRLVHIRNGGIRLLCSLMSSERLLVSPRNSDAEDLCLSGFIRLERLGDIVVVTWMSSMIEKVFRQNCSRLLSGSIPSNGFNDLQRPCHAINTHAYRLVLELETLLRNTMVGVLASEDLGGWREAAKNIKVPSLPAEAYANEFQHFGRKIISALYPEFDFSAIPEIDLTINKFNSPDEQKKRKLNMVGVVEAALEWRQRCSQECWVRPVEDSLPQFMTTGALMNVFLGKDRCELLVKACFNDREQAKTFFTKFAGLRSSVMHIHSLGMSVIEDLLMLKRELLSRLGRHNA